MRLKLDIPELQPVTLDEEQNAQVSRPHKRLRLDIPQSTPLLSFTEQGDPTFAGFDKPLVAGFGFNTQSVLTAPLYGQQNMQAEFAKLKFVNDQDR
jgi:hypothetical protein